ncbi:hypothetical protein Bbelb_134020 [Branchiostoma belcheri]|nr:hypothetical protein Bbelb_134020 [Branchiostoma belcheri]
MFRVLTAKIMTLSPCTNASVDGPAFIQVLVRCDIYTVVGLEQPVNCQGRCRENHDVAAAKIDGDTAGNIRLPVQSAALRSDPLRMSQIKAATPESTYIIWRN